MNPTAEQIDALKELTNIGVGRAAGVLSEMLQTHIHLQVPFIKIFSPQELEEEMEDFGREQLSSVGLGFRGSFSGTAALVFPPDSASELVAILTGEEVGSPDLDSVRTGTLSEVGNIVINGVMGSIGNVLEHRLDYSIPSYSEGTIESLLTSNEPDSGSRVLLAQTHFAVEERLIEGDIYLFFEAGSFDALLDAIDALISTYGA